MMCGKLITTKYYYNKKYRCGQPAVNIWTHKDCIKSALKRCVDHKPIDWASGDYKILTEDEYTKAYIAELFE